MDGTLVSVAKLYEDHNALAEAVHGLLGRIGLLEARTDYLEHGREDAVKLADRTGRTPLPAAIETGLSHLGRALWMVEGETGLWSGKQDFDGSPTRSLWVAMPNRRGRSRSKRLYRLAVLSDRMATVLEKCVGSDAEPNTKGNSNGS